MPKLSDERDNWILVQSLAKFDVIMFRTLFHIIYILEDMYV